MAWLGEVGEFGLNHIPAKNAACESGPEGSNPSLSAITTERTALGVVVTRGDVLAVLDRDARVPQEPRGFREAGGASGVPGLHGRALGDHGRPRRREHLRLH